MSTDSRDRLEQAFAWQSRLADQPVSTDERRAFFAWLRAAPENAAAYEHAEKFWHGLGPLGAERNRRRTEPALAQFQADGPVTARPGIVPVPGSVSTAAANDARNQRWGLRLAAAAVFLACCLGTALFVSRQPESSAAAAVRVSYATPVGAIETFTLSDGSRVTLGADSQVTVALAPRLRDVLLTRGEALFEVAPEPRRPFVVRAGATEVDVTGTTFEVRHSRHATRIAVLEGSVNVASGTATAAGTAGAGVQLVAGQGATYAQGALGVPVAVDLAKIGAFRNHRLVFNDATLAEVIADANRYDQRNIAIQGENLKQLTVTTSFDARNIDAAFAALEELFPLVVDEISQNQILIRPHPGSSP